MLDDEIIVSGSKAVKLLSLPDFPRANLFGAEVYDGNDAGVTEPVLNFNNCEIATAERIYPLSWLNRSTSELIFTKPSSHLHELLRGTVTLGEARLETANDQLKAIGFPITVSTVELEEREFALNMMESDARQSNAGLISILVGDSNSASILGLLPQMLDTNEELHPGLREKIFSTVDEDVKATFTAPDDGPYKAAWGKLLSSLSVARGNRAAKDYARGLVVAGLYGKTSQKMYSEATDMLSQINAATYNNPELFEAFNELTSNYSDGVNSMEILDDITDILTTASHSHMSKLNGYQTAMKSIGGAMAAINAPTSIRNMLGGIQQISGNNLSPILRDNIEMQVFGDNISRKNDHST